MRYFYFWITDVTSRSNDIFLQFCLSPYSMKWSHIFSHFASLFFIVAHAMAVDASQGVTTPRLESAIDSKKSEESPSTSLSDAIAMSSAIGTIDDQQWICSYVPTDWKCQIPLKSGRDSLTRVGREEGRICTLVMLTVLYNKLLLNVEVPACINKAKNFEERQNIE